MSSSEDPVAASPEKEKNIEISQKTPKITKIIYHFTIFSIEEKIWKKSNNFGLPFIPSSSHIFSNPESTNLQFFDEIVFVWFFYTFVTDS